MKNMDFYDMIDEFIRNVKNMDLDIDDCCRIMGYFTALELKYDEDLDKAAPSSPTSSKTILKISDVHTEGLRLPKGSVITTDIAMETIEKWCSEHFPNYYTYKKEMDSVHFQTGKKICTDYRDGEPCIPVCEKVICEYTEKYTLGIILKYDREDMRNQPIPICAMKASKSSNIVYEDMCRLGNILETVLTEFLRQNKNKIMASY